MANPTAADILFRSGGAELVRTGVPWLRGSRVDGREVEKYTHTRADASTCATYVDVNGAIRKAAAAKLRQSYDYGNSRYGLLLESASTNLCLQSENFGTTWSANGTPTRSSSVASSGAVNLDLIGDDDAAAYEGYYQAFATGVVATGNNALSVFVAAGATVTVCQFYLNDTTASANRLVANINFTAGVVTVTCTTGSCIAITTLAGGVYRLLFQTTTCLVANGHRLYANPAASTVTDVGNIYMGGVQLENRLYPTSYIAVTTAVVTRAADALTFPIGTAPQDLTVYVRMARPPWADATGTFGVSPTIVMLGGDGSTQGAALFGLSTARSWVAWLGGQSVSASVPAGATQEVCAQFRYTTDAKCRLDVGSGFGSLSSAGTATFANALARVGCLTSTPGDELNGTIERLLVLKGSFTLAECQSVAW